MTGSPKLEFGKEDFFVKMPSLGAICLLQSVPQVHFFKFRELSNSILEGDVEKPSLGAICLLQSVPQIHFF